ncbi:hypothetical protein, conserved, partial [Babesia bigemina]
MELSGAVIGSMYSVITAARRNYVSSIKSLLTAFADKVEKELKELPEEIERDLTIGFKGLMRQIGGDNNGNMELLKSQKDDSTASKLSYVFR